jgi:hypothetical protein
VIDALRRFAPSFLQERRVSAGQHATLEVLLGCRTAARGGYRYECENCGYTAVLYGSCGNRYCSQCQAFRRYQWAETKQRLLLPVLHHQVVVTLPSELRSLATRFPDEIYDLLFKAGRTMLLKLAATHWNATPGILAVLHTWARNLSHHPHVHFVVSAGGLTADGQWTGTDGARLFPVDVMSPLFKGIFLSELTKLGLPLSVHERIALRHARRRAAAKRWNVHVDPAIGRDPANLVKYLARYVYQGAISDHRIVDIDDQSVTIRTRGSETVQLDGEEFVRRFAQHVLPKGFRRIRQYGLLAPSARPKLEQARAAIANAPTPPPVPEPPPPDEAADAGAEPLDDPASPKPCPVCGHLMHFYIVFRDLRPLARGPP